MIRARLINKLLSSYSTKSKIPFDFKLPPQEPPSNIFNKTQSTDKQIKLVKLKRKGTSAMKLIPKQPEYQRSQDTMSTAQKLHDEKFKKTVEEGQKTRNYYQFEIQRGEDLIDQVPVDPYYQYKMSDLRRMIQERKKQFEKFQGLQEQYDHRKENLETLSQGFVNSKHRYQIDQFEKYLKKYPGSLKGPNPEDDPQSYADYARKQMPPFLMAQIGLKNKTSMNRQKANDQNQSVPSGAFVSDFLSEDRYEIDLNDPEFADNLEDQIKNDFANQTKLIVPYRDVSVLPNVDFVEFNSYIAKLQLWWEFGEYYFLNHYDKNMKIIQNTLSLMGEQLVRQNGGSYQLKPAIFSLYLYYRTLPKQIRQSSTVRTVFLGLEHNQPDYTYEQKQQALNKAAYMSLPFDKVSQRLMEDVTAKKKYYLTPHLTDRIFNIHPQFTWDIHQFMNQVKEQKLRSMSTVKQKQQSYPQPPQLHKISESHLANLPVDFYDNDDGFWDDYIDQKLERYHKVQPLSSKEKVHFIH